MDTANQSSNCPLDLPERRLWLPKMLLCILGLGLFATNPWRDLQFHQTIAAHEGFGTTADAFIIGFAVQLLATAVTFPLAIFLIVFGIGCSTRISLVPTFDRWTWIWGGIATVLAGWMLWIEGDYLLYSLGHLHHWKTALISASYIGFIYVWWCCSISHRKTDIKSPCLN